MSRSSVHRPNGSDGVPPALSSLKERGGEGFPMFCWSAQILDATSYESGGAFSLNLLAIVRQPGARPSFCLPWHFTALHIVPISC